MKRIPSLLLALLSVPLLSGAGDLPHEHFDITDDCFPVCSGESNKLVPLYDDMRLIGERTNGPCGPQAVAIAAGKMCSRPNEIKSLIDEVQPRYFWMWDVGMPPEDIATDLNWIFWDPETNGPWAGCPGNGRWEYRHADDRERIVSESEYIAKLTRSTSHDRVAVALVQASDDAGKKLSPHWMVVLRVADIAYVDERGTGCYVTAQDARGQGVIPCSNFYEMALAVLDYPFFGTTMGVVWFEFDSNYAPAPKR